MDGIRMDGWDEDGWMDFHVDRIEWCINCMLQKVVAQNPRILIHHGRQAILQICLDQNPRGWGHGVPETM